MKKIIIFLIATIIIGCATIIPNLGVSVINAQTLPYTLTVAWDASADAASYNCYLDGVQKINVTTTTCSFPVTALGAHVVGVTAVNPTFVPNESVPTNLSFTLKQPSPAANIKVK